MFLKQPCYQKFPAMCRKLEREHSDYPVPQDQDCQARAAEEAQRCAGGYEDRLDRTDHYPSVSSYAVVREPSLPPAWRQRGLLDRVNQRLGELSDNEF